jgi:very-short-patch-repair endonuclease
MAQDYFLLRWAKLYSSPTEAEEAIEPAIASLGIRYRFQHPLWGLSLFPDFALPDDRVLIEVDDPSHNTKKKRIEDQERTTKLNKHNWRVVRCTNDEAIKDPYGTVDRMMEEMKLPYRTNNVISEGEL